MTGFFKVDVLSVSKSQNKPKTIQKAQTNAGRITYIVIVLIFDNYFNFNFNFILPKVNTDYMRQAQR